ncbi:hypothetical protein EV182_008677, partial [Spiromyces aspiralis]
RPEEDESSSDLEHSDGDKDLVDPFERRIEHCKTISAELLGVLERYAEKAEKLIGALQKQQQPQEHQQQPQEQQQQPQEQQQQPQEQQQQQEQQSWRGRLRRRRGRGAQ